VQRAREQLAREAKRAESQAKQQAWEKRQVDKQLARKLRSGSDVSSDDASTCAETASVVEDVQARRCSEILQNARNATLALSPQEEKEARKVEKKLRDITRLQTDFENGFSLDNLQLEKIKSRDALESLLVMQKIRAGALRPTI